MKIIIAICLSVLFYCIGCQCSSSQCNELALKDVELSEDYYIVKKIANTYMPDVEFINHDNVELSLLSEINFTKMSRLLNYKNVNICNGHNENNKDIALTLAITKIVKKGDMAYVDIVRYLRYPAGQGYYITLQKKNHQWVIVKEEKTFNID